jgi:beta-mannosidase
MEAHQKCLSGNTKILTYLSDKYRYPTDFGDLVYASELLQLDAMRYGVEHFRRFRGRSMGALFWQLNDSWPVASWSAVDYFGRWKALMYGARRFFAPVLLSAHEKGTTVTFNVANETMESFKGHIRWRILDQDLNLYLADTAMVEVPALSSLDIVTRDFEEETAGKERCRFLSYELYDEDGLPVSVSSLLFCRPKQFEYRQPDIKAAVTLGPQKENRRQYLIEVSADTFASHVEIDFPHYDLLLSDNYFEITDTEKLLIVAELHQPDPATRAAAPLSDIPSAEDLQKDLTIRSVYDIGR